ncbi:MULTISPECIES: GNAT family N-acetyltransferase [Microbacterium]|uniref:GNAT family N-acetyltransferase n=1 Tax=Microbacterium TaxID=33882 RepID=UPI00277E6AB7|nr:MULTISPECIES: GNAT family N-acetyltransferase [Microbacterium]MDQ1083314.1 putative acetyltransferase [Microbacterium sp. SORGH_AS_0344]MDQ1171406.1 putative acetyltransferase [Microbacterium proteolyticum]
MASLDTLTLPLDRTSTEELASRGLEYARVDPDGDGYRPFQRAVARGFLGGESTDEEAENARLTLRTRRLTGVYDRGGAEPEVPVGTVDSWATELTTSPGRQIDLWAISAVTVAPTHRRRGIARAMLGGELRTAADAGFALAGLTVTEATIYARWGFSPATWASDVHVDTRRAGWSGPVAPGRLDFVPREGLIARIAAVHERVRRQRPGAVPGWDGRWRGVAGLAPGDKAGEKVRAVAYRDPEGIERGIVAYTIDDRDDFSAHDLEVRALFAETPEAYGALWRFLLEHDLVGTVKAALQAPVPPLQWMVTDRRAVTATLTDHHWLRILDVPRAVASRAYSAPLRAVVRVSDPLGFADGAWKVRIGDDGEAVVEAAEPTDAVEVDMTVNALGSLLLGGTRIADLAAAGIASGDPAVLAAVDRSFAPAMTPLLDIWY